MIVKQIVAVSLLAFSVVGFAETAVSLIKEGTYHLGKNLLYSLLIGIAIGLLH